PPVANTFPSGANVPGRISSVCPLSWNLGLFRMVSRATRARIRTSADGPSVMAGGVREPLRPALVFEPQDFLAGRHLDYGVGPVLRPHQPPVVAEECDGAGPPRLRLDRAGSLVPGGQVPELVYAVAVGEEPLPTRGHCPAPHALEPGELPGDLLVLLIPDAE